MVGLLMADGIGGHVRQDKVGRTAERGAQLLGRRLGHEIELEDVDAYQAFGLTFGPPKGRFGGSILGFWNRITDYQFERTVPNSGWSTIACRVGRIAVALRR